MNVLNYIFECCIFLTLSTYFFIIQLMTDFKLLLINDELNDELNVNNIILIDDEN